MEGLLSRISSYELSEWMAYEKAAGPLGRQYSDDMLANIHEILQSLLRLTGAQWGDDNPVPPPLRLKRPLEIFLPDDEDDEEDEDEDQSLEDFMLNFE